ncbi:hypothetical protein AAC387_Pa05g2274 [Persea americana]
MGVGKNRKKVPLSMGLLQDMLQMKEMMRIWVMKPAHTSRGEEDDADLLIFVARLGKKKASSEENVLSLETREVCV